MKTEKTAVFLTGGSKGIGFALLKTCLEQGFFVVNFSRTKPEVEHQRLTHISCDFSDFESATLHIQNAFSKLNQADFSQLILINNAGVLEPMYPMGSQVDSKAIQNHFTVNTLLPTDSTSRFIFTFSNFSGYKLVINVGSGAANQPIEGWAVYGASKSALHYFSNTVAVEQKSVKFPVIVSLFDPGRTDTQMQAQIRASSTQNFPLVDSFKTAFEAGKLNNPFALAHKVVERIQSKTIQQGDLLSHRELLL